MFVSSELRKSNIAEYLLYMWQVEDTIRATGLDEDRLYNLMIQPSSCSDADRKEWKQWYSDLIRMMIEEEKRDKGHLQINDNVLIMLDDLHARLLESSKHPEYRELYYKVLPLIVEFRQKNGDTGNNEIRDCFELMYGVWMLRLQKKDISEATQKAVKAVSGFLGTLAAFYKEDKAGTLELD